jgi:hypothetical protein
MEGMQGRKAEAENENADFLPFYLSTLNSRLSAFCLSALP